MKNRSIKQILKKEEEFCNKIRYNRHKCLAENILFDGEKCDPKIWEWAKKSAKKVESKYPEEELSFDDFEWGMINGKLSALRWILWEDWDMLDT